MAKYRNMTASAQVKSGNGQVTGVIVNSHTAGTLKLWDSLTASGLTIMNTYTFPSGSSTISFGDVGGRSVIFDIGLFATIGGTADITILFD